MTFYFNADGDTLTLLDIKNTAYTQNVNTYICQFSLNEDWRGIIPFATFIFGDNSYTVPLNEANSCFIPYEVLQHSGNLYVGLFGTSGNEASIKRISTNTQAVSVLNGTYSENTRTPTPPEPQAWEALLSRSIPIIGENGNWYIWEESIKIQTNLQKVRPLKRELTISQRMI